jgi:hypothetical protein
MEEGEVVEDALPETEVTVAGEAENPGSVGVGGKIGKETAAELDQGGPETGAARGAGEVGELPDGGVTALPASRETEGSGMGQDLSVLSALDGDEAAGFPGKLAVFPGPLVETERMPETLGEKNAQGGDVLGTGGTDVDHIGCRLRLTSRIRRPRRLRAAPAMRPGGR